MKIDLFVLAAAVMVVSGSASVAAEARVLYSVHVSADKRVVIKVDTNGMPPNASIPQADIKLVLKDYGGNVLAPARQYSITAWTGPLVPRQVYEVRFPNNFNRARYAVVVEPVAWAVEARGAKLDGQPSEAEVLDSAVPTVLKGQGTVALPPPSSNTVQHCSDYAQTAVAQDRTQRTRQCGLVGPRWSNTFNYHYRWCLGVSSTTSDRETIARSNALRNCN